jgi:hypothetical protein
MMIAKFHRVNDGLKEGYVLILLSLWTQFVEHPRTRYTKCGQKFPGLHRDGNMWMIPYIYILLDSIVRIPSSHNEEG